MTNPLVPLAPENAVLVQLTTEWSSGNASVHTTLQFQAVSLDQALAMIRHATEGAPMLKSPEEGT